MKPKHIDRNNLPGMRQLTPMEMNKERFQPKHTVLTPELLESVSRQEGDQDADGRS